MASIIPGFEYDIFISYRQNDNKHNGWVTEFVENLKAELESTIKDEISVYFDENPHDRLLETYDVNKSLEIKLKSFIFIPVVSQTYCDPKSYAWQNEFLAFNTMSKEDSLGRDLKLRNGNVASRILPVRIHDLLPEDISLFEKVTGGKMRAVDFIYKTASGVNRPLRANEDHPNGNLNKTYYRDQINKLAHAINELITSQKKSEPGTSTESSFYSGMRSESPKGKSKTRMIIGLLLFIVALSAIFLIVRKNFTSDDEDSMMKLEKSVAVLPFRNDSPNDTNTYFINGVMEEILDHLQMVKDIRVISRTSVEQYRNTTKSIPQIAKEQGVNYIVAGSGQKYGKEFNLKIQLIRAVKEKQLLGRSYNQEISRPSDIMNVQSKIAQAIVGELNASITPEVKQKIERVNTNNLNAYNYYQKGREDLLKFWIDNDNYTALGSAGNYFLRAIRSDSLFADAYAGLAEVVLYKNYWKDFYTSTDLDSVLLLANKAISIDNHLPEAYFAKGSYYAAKGQKTEAFNEYDKTLELNPNHGNAYYGKAMLYEFDDQVRYLDNLKKVTLINHSDLLVPTVIRNIGGKLLVTGWIDDAKSYFRKAFELDRDSAFYLSCLGGTESDQGNFKKSIGYFTRAYNNRQKYSSILVRLGEDYQKIGKHEESLKYFKLYTDLTHDYNPSVAYAYWCNGFKKEANRLFDASMESAFKLTKSDRPISQLFFVYYNLAEIYSFRGDKENALKNLRLFSGNKTCELWMLTHLKFDPLLDNIRNEPEFKKIYDEMENKYRKIHADVGKWLENNASPQ